MWKTLVGEWRDGLPNGQGTYAFASGEQYAGNWQDDKKHGLGTITYPDGFQYVGEWRDGECFEEQVDDPQTTPIRP